MIVLCAFLAGMAFLIAVAACLAVQREQERAQGCERALHAAMAEQAELIFKMAKNHQDLERMIRAVAAASVPPVYPVGQVHIVVPGPRTAQ